MNDFEKMLKDLVKQYKEVDLETIEEIDRNGGVKNGYTERENFSHYGENRKYDAYEGEYYD